MLKETLAALRLEVTIGEDRRTVALKPGDLVRFEEHFGRPLATAEGEFTFGITEMSYLGFLGAKRAGMFDGDWEAFKDAVDDLDIADPAETTSLGKAQ